MIPLSLNLPVRQSIALNGENSAIISLLLFNNSGSSIGQFPRESKIILWASWKVSGAIAFESIIIGASGGL